MREQLNPPALSLVLVTALAACGGGTTGPQGGQTSPGEQRTGRTTALETSANLLQSKTPVEQISMYLVGFHPAKDDPQMQMESHHFCDQVNEDLAQCVLYDGNTKGARLHGVEYIISARLFGTLPAEERQYWHPHNYEILSGTLRMPGIPDAAEHAAMATKINSYGKTWHFWKTGVFGEQPDTLPLGPPHLAWSFNHDGEAKPGLVEARDQRQSLNSTDARTRRQDLASQARPQQGVSALANAFPNAKGAPGGVQDAAR